MIKNFKWLLFASLSIVACNNNDNNSSNEVPLTAGSADFSKYVALGDSFAAGYSDGALFKTGQDGGYPNIMAQQFALVGGGSFNIPYMKDDIGGFSYGGTQLSQFPTRLYLVGTTPTYLTGTSSTLITDHISGTLDRKSVV